MLDRMLTTMCTMYSPLCPAPFSDNGDPHNWSGGGRRVLKTIMFSMLYSKNEEAELQWKKKFLEKYHFKHGGTIPAIGWKHKRPLSLCQMYFTTARDLHFGD